jgi:uncharacterized protein YciI
VPQRLQVLNYEYVEDIVERRGPHRPIHLELIAAWHADGRVVMGGAVGDPPHAGLIVFAEDADVAAFVAADPYAQQGLVARWTVEPWTVVT